MSIASLREMTTSVSGSVFSYSGCLTRGAVSSPQNGSNFKLQVRDFIQLSVIFLNPGFAGKARFSNVICSVVVSGGF